MNACAKNVRVDLIKINSNDEKELTKVQTKLNQWITLGLLVKYEVHTIGEYILFNVCRLKDSGE